MPTRAQWLKENPPPECNGPLFDRAAELRREGHSADADKIEKQAKAALHCAQHPTEPLYRHRDRPEDLFTCSVGPHFLVWTLDAGQKALRRIDLKDLAPRYELRDGKQVRVPGPYDFDAPMPGARNHEAQ